MAVSGTFRIMLDKKRSDSNISILGQEWINLRLRLDRTLCGTSLIDDDLRKFCLGLDGLSFDERAALIEGRFGSVVLQNVQAVLSRLETVEKELSNLGVE